MKPYFTLIQKKKAWHSFFYLTASLLAFIGIFNYSSPSHLVLAISLCIWNILEFKKTNFYEFRLKIPDTEYIGIYSINNEKYACHTEEEAFIHADAKNAVPIFLENVKKFI